MDSDALYYNIVQARFGRATRERLEAILPEFPQTEKGQRAATRQAIADTNKKSMGYLSKFNSD